MEKFLENLEKSEKTMQTAGHLVYVTYPLVQDKRLLLKILVEIKNSISDCINSVLQYEYMFSRVKVSQEPKINFRIFIEKCCPRYGISEEEARKISRLFELAEKHKKSPMEFVREEKIVILSENMNYDAITLEKVKEFLAVSKSILEKAKRIILR